MTALNYGQASVAEPEVGGSNGGDGAHEEAEPKEDGDNQGPWIKEFGLVDA